MTSIMRTVRSAWARGWQLLFLLSETETRERISIAAQRYNTSRLAVIKRIIKLFVSEKFYPLESLANGLADPGEPFTRHQEYFSREGLHGLQTSVNTNSSAMCRDKLLFHVYCRRYGLPVPDLYGVISRHGSRDDKGTPLDNGDQLSGFIQETLPTCFIAKPRGGNKGRGIMLIGESNTDSAPKNYPRIKREVESLVTGEEDYLLEQRILIHPSISEMTGTEAVSTVRVVTFVPFGEAPKIMGAVFRVIADDSITDNISDFETGGYSGNVLASVDIETGIVHWALTPCRDGVGRDFIEVHPKTSRSIPGFQVPLWEDAKALCIRAAGAFLPLRTIGWDVAITQDGPILIEANELFQYSASGPNVPVMRAAMQREKSRQRQISL